MSRYMKCLLIIVLLLSQVYAQESDSLNIISRSIEFGLIEDIYLTDDGYLFAACGYGGLRVYNYSGTSIEPVTYRYDGGMAMDVAIDSNGIIFLANRYDGLRAYDFDGSELSCVGHVNDGLPGSDEPVFIHDGEDAWGVDIGPDGHIYLANFRGDILGYSFDSGQFLNEAGVNTGGWSHKVSDVEVDIDTLAHWIEYPAHTGITLGPDGKVFRAGDSEIEMTSGSLIITDTDFDGYGRDVAVINDTMLVAVTSQSIRLYTFTDTTLTLIGTDQSSNGYCVISDGPSIIVGGYSDISIYSVSDGQITLQFRFPLGAPADVGFGPDRVYTASGGAGVMSYVQTVPILTFSGNLQLDSWTNYVSDQAGVFLFCGRSTELSKVDVSSDLPVLVDTWDLTGYNRGGVLLNEEGTVFIDDNGLRAYSSDGGELVLLDEITEHGNAESISLINDDIIAANFQSPAGGGSLRLYSWNNSQFIELAASAGNYSDASAVSASPEGQVIVIAYQDYDLSALTNEEGILTEVAQYTGTYDRGHTRDVAVGPDGTVFLAANYDGVIAFDISNQAFEEICRLKLPSYTRSVSVSGNGNIYAATEAAGLIALSFSPYSDNTPPQLAQIEDTTFLEDSSIELPVSVSDVDGDDVSLEAWSVESDIQVSISPEILSITANLNWFGDATVFVRALDYLSADTVHFTISVLPVNDAPSASALISPSNQAILPDTAATMFTWHPSQDTEGDSVWYDLSLWSAENDTMVSTNDTTLALIPVEYGFVDGDLVNWRVLSFDGQDSSESDIRSFSIDHSVDLDASLNFPQAFVLENNYPNPFNPSTTIRYGLPEDSEVNLVIYDIRGNVVRTLASDRKSAGWHDLTWNGQNDQGLPIGTGLYLARIQAGDYQKVIKMMYLK